MELSNLVVTEMVKNACMEAAIESFRDAHKTV